MSTSTLAGGAVDDAEWKSGLGGGLLAKRIDWNITAGGGLDMAGFGRRTITLDGRYTWGLTDVFDLAGDPEARSTSMTVTVGFGL